MPQFRVLVDADSNGSFERDLTADVLGVLWELGMAAASDGVAAPSSGRVRLRGADRAYSPEAAAQPLLPGMPVHIQSVDEASVTRTHFTGYVERVEPAAGALGAGEALLILCGRERELGEARVCLPPQTGKRADQLVLAVLEAARLHDPLIGDRLQIGIPGHAEVGSAKLGGTPFSASLQTGRSTFDYAAEPELDGLTAADALAEILTAERGRFYTRRDGTFVFLNRHYGLTDAPPDAAFDDDMDGLEYEYGGEMVNAVRVQITPRSTGAAGSLLWQTAALRVDSGQGRTVLARFHDSQGQPCGAAAVSVPLAGVDWSANSRADGTGADVTARVRVRLMEWSTNAARLEVLYYGAGTAWVTINLRGTPLLRDAPMTVDCRDTASVTRYGLHSREWRSAAFTRAEEAEDMARWLIAQRKAPRGRVRVLHLNGAQHSAAMLARTLFDRVSIHETQTGHSGVYHIVGEAHEVDRGGYRHRVRWLLEGADEGFFLIGIHRPDGTRALAG